MKVLLLSCSTGEGHNSAAFALQEELESRGVDCVLADPVAFGSEKARKAVANTYNNIISNPFLQLCIAGAENTSGHRHQVRRKVQHSAFARQLGNGLLNLWGVTMGGYAIGLEAII